MTDIERIDRYIQNTKIENRIRYDMGYSEIIALVECGRVFEIITTAFEFGRAKGFRAAKAMDR